jgi:large subunit ribosomal protein L17
MRGTPTKGKRFGGSSAHQKAMMGNLVASMIAAESIVTTEAKAKALRPIVEKVVTAARTLLRVRFTRSVAWWRSFATRT